MGTCACDPVIVRDTGVPLGLVGISLVPESVRDLVSVMEQAAGCPPMASVCSHGYAPLHVHAQAHTHTQADISPHKHIFPEQGIIK